jgi:lysophospholipase L1-like esterase
VRRAATLIALATAVMAAASACAASPPARQASPRTRASHRTTYYLSLGDSLSQGVQPDPAGASTPTRQGYPNQLFKALHPSDPGLRLVKLGCGGETTTTMIEGGICSYPAGSQLAAAVSFLRAHRGQVSLITIDIGANDSASCLADPNIGAMASCVGKSLPVTVANLRKIMMRLRSVGGSKVRIIGMSYYVPTLADWRDGPVGQEIAQLTEQVVTRYNKVLTGIYTAYGARVANVFTAFHSGDFTDRVTLRGIGTVPRNVAAICLWTWECTSAPRGPNIHANKAGYGVIAQAFLLADRG